MQSRKRPLRWLPVLVASLYAAISQQVAPLLGPGAQVVELGCGTGQMLTRLCAETGASGIGLDLSADAVRQAAVIGPSLTWVVVNVDRYVPIGDESVDLAAGDSCSCRTDVAHTIENLDRKQEAAFSLVVERV